MLCPREAEDAGYMQLEGEWSFPLDHFYQSKSVEVDTAGAVRWDGETRRMVTLETLTLSPLSAAFTLTYPSDPEAPTPFVHFALELVFRDGSSLVVDSANGQGGPVPDTPGLARFTGVDSFDAPLDLNQLDHIQFGEYRLELPAAK